MPDFLGNPTAAEAKALVAASPAPKSAPVVEIEEPADVPVKKARKRGAKSEG